MTCARVAKVRAIAVAKEQRASVQKACAQASLKSPATMAAMAKPIPVPGRSSGSLTRNQSDTSLPSPIGDEAAVSAQAPKPPQNSVSFNATSQLRFVAGRGLAGEP